MEVAVEDVLCASDVSVVEDVLHASDFAADPPAVEDAISDSGTDSGNFSLLLLLSAHVAEDGVLADTAISPPQSVAAAHGVEDAHSTVTVGADDVVDTDNSPNTEPHPITVKKTRKRRKNGISKRKDGRSGKVTQNRGLPPTRQTKIISPAKTPVKLLPKISRIKPIASCEKSTSKEIIIIQELREKIVSFGDLNEKLLKDNKQLEKKDAGAQRTIQKMKESCDVKVAKADKLVQKQRDRVSSTQETFAQSLKKQDISTKKKSIILEKEHLEKDHKHELVIGSLEVRYHAEKEKSKSDHIHDMEYMEAVLLEEREKHKSEMDRLMQVIRKQQEEGDNKVEALKRDHGHEIKTVVDNHARQIGKMKKRERENETKVKRAKLLKDTAKTKASSAISTAVEAEKRAEASAKHREKAKRSATEEIRRQRDAKKQKATELSQMTNDFVDVQQQLIDAQEDRDAALKIASECNVPSNEIENFTSIFRKCRISKRGGKKQYSVKLVQIILEMIVNGCPPSSIRAILLIFAQTFDPTFDLRHLPCISYIRRCRSILLTVTKVIAALRLSKAENWGQMFTDATSIAQVPLQDIILSLKDHDVFKPIVLSAATVLQNGESAVAVVDTILTTIQDSGELLAGFKDVVERDFPGFEHDIPEKHEMTVGKLVNGHITTDTCSPARKTNCGLQDSVMEAAKIMLEKAGKDASNIKVYEVMCWHHLRNIWFKAVVGRLTRYLNEAMEEHLSELDPDDRISPGMDNLVRVCEKYFCLKKHDAKGDGERFHQWMESKHPGVILMSLERACAGARFDICIEGACAIFWNRKYYIQFLQEQKKHKMKAENKFVRSLYVILSSRQMVALTRICAIFHVSMVMPHRYLAGKCDKLSESDDEWGVSSMALVADTIDNALTELIKEPTKFLDRQFMMKIFDKFKYLEPFNQWWDHAFVSGRKTNTVGKTKALDRVFVMKELLDAVFDSTDAAIKETDGDVIKLGEQSAITFKGDMHDGSKATVSRLTEGGGKFCWGTITAEEKEAGKGKKAVNDPAESIFARIKSEVLRFGMISFAHAAGVSQSKMNGDFTRVFGEDDDSGLGYFHQLPREMQEALIVFAEEKLKEVGVDHRNAMKAHREHTEKRHEAESKAYQARCEKKYEQELRLHQMIGTSAVWMTEDDVDRELTKFGSPKKKLEAVKEQWRIWTKGAGWKDAHQPFSKGGKSFDSAYLADQLKANIICKYLANSTPRTIRSAPSAPFSFMKPFPEIGDTLCDVLAMKEEEAVREKEVMSAVYEKCGLTVQPCTMPSQDSLVGRKIQLMHTYSDEEDDGDRGYNVWYTGEVISSSDGEVTIEWEGEWENEEDRLTVEELEEKDWVTEGGTLGPGSWRLA